MGPDTIIDIARLYPLGIPAMVVGAVGGLLYHLRQEREEQRRDPSRTERADWSARVLVGAAAGAVVWASIGILA